MAARQQKVFISSTFRDLREYRKAVRGVLEENLKLEFINNEELEASPEEPMNAMYKLIDQCEIFIGIYARYYGRIPPGRQVSYIEAEYEYAKANDKPMFCFILDRNQQWPSQFTESEPRFEKQLYAFIDMVIRERIVNFFTDPEDLAGKVLAAVRKYFSEMQSDAGSTSDEDEKFDYGSDFTDGSSGYIEIDKDPRSSSDRPSGIDRLNYSKYAEAFSKVVLNHETGTPLTIGIYGQWGQGKSFLMGKIKEALKASREDSSSFSFTQFWKRTEKLQSENSPGRLTAFFNSFSKWVVEGSEAILAFMESPSEWVKAGRKARREKVDFHVVEFNAWAYTGTDHLWAGLVTQLYREAEKYFGLRLVTARLWRSLKRSLPKSLVIFGFYALLGLGISLLINSEEINKTFGDLANAVKTFGISALGGAGLAGLPVLWTTLKDFVDNLFLTRSKNLQNLAARPDFRVQIGVMADIKDEIHFIGTLLHKGKRGHSTRFVLFIDDLDRCEHKKAVEVLQAVMLLLSDEDGAPFVIFLGIDDRVIVRAIEASYGDVLVSAGIKGYEFLDKIVQIPFVIPMPSDADISSYVNSLILTDEEKKLILEEQLKQQAQTQGPTGGEAQIPSGTPEIAVAAPPEEKVGALIAIGVSLTEPERKTIEDCTIYLTKNPRKIKRLINIYRFSRLLMPGALRKKAIYWFLMTEQWPLHVAWIVAYITDDQQTKSKLGNKYISDAYKLAKKDIRSSAMETYLAIDADPDEFEVFIKNNRFSVRDVLDLLPYTFNLNTSISSAVNQQKLKAVEPKPKPRRRKPATQSKKKPTAQTKRRTKSTAKQ